MKPPRRKAVAPAEFWSLFYVAAPDVCWTSRVPHRSEYPIVRIIQNDGSIITERGNRTAYRLHYGKEPGQYFVLHSCDNPKCVNPHHLRLGTALDNMRDRTIRKRNWMQEAYIKAHLNELTATQKAALIKGLNEGETYISMRRLYGVSVECWRVLKLLQRRNQLPMVNNL